MEYGLLYSWHSSLMWTIRPFSWIFFSGRDSCHPGLCFCHFRPPFDLVIWKSLQSPATIQNGQILWWNFRGPTTQGKNILKLDIGSRPWQFLTRLCDLTMLGPNVFWKLIYSEKAIELKKKKPKLDWQTEISFQLRSFNYFKDLNSN